MKTHIHFSAQLEHVNAEIQENSAHQMRVSIDTTGNHVLVQSTSREALFELGRTLMHEALFGSGEIELFPLITETGALVVNGVRLSEDSARLFIHFPSEGKHAV